MICFVISGKCRIVTVRLVGLHEIWEERYWGAIQITFNQSCFFKFTIFFLFEQGSCPTAYEKVKKIMASFQYFFCIWFCQYWWSKLFSHFYDLWWKLLYKWFSWVEKKCTFLFTFRVFRGLVTNQRELLLLGL